MLQDGQAGEMTRPHQDDVAALVLLVCLGLYFLLIHRRVAEL